MLALVTLVAFSSQVLACSCARNPNAQEIHSSAAAVFTGTVESSVTEAGGKTVTVFKVVESFKGVQNGVSVRVSHRRGPSTACGVAFTPGESYTIAAYQTETPQLFGTNLCLTWMFLPHVGLSARLIEEMRVLQRHLR